MKHFAITLFLLTLLSVSGICGSLNQYDTLGNIKNSYTQGTIVVTHPNGTYDGYSTGSTNTEKGANLLTILAAATSGDCIELLNGTYNVGDNRVIIPDGVTLKGKGWNTIIQSEYDTAGVPIFLAGNGCIISDIYLYQSYAASGQTFLPFGNTAGSTSYLFRVKIFGSSDVLNDINNGGTYYLYSCNLSSNWDVIYIRVGTTVYAYDTDITATYSATGSASTSTRGVISPYNGVFKGYNCRINAVATSGGSAHGISSTASSSRHELHNCVISTSSGDTNYDVFGSDVLIDDCSGSGQNYSVTTSGNPLQTMPSIAANGLSSINGASLNTELTTNGTFDSDSTGWTLGSGWAWSDTNDNVAKTGNGTATVSPTTALTLRSGRYYVISFVTSGWTTGTLTPSIGGVTLPVLSRNGTMTEYFKATATTNLAFTPSATARIAIDSITVKEIIGGDITAYGNYRVNDNYMLTKTVRRTIGWDGATGTDFVFTGDADHTAQNKDFGAIIPAFARVVDVSVICTETLAPAGAILIRIGNASTGEQFIAGADVDDADEVLGTATGTWPLVAISGAASNIFIGADPDANWADMTAGKWTVLVTYIDNNVAK